MREAEAQFVIATANKPSPSSMIFKRQEKIKEKEIQEKEQSSNVGHKNSMADTGKLAK